jgi:P27 family predicted phage terminase small subunit
MGSRGPRPMPAALKVLRGGSRQRRPATIGDPPTMPAGLSEAEQACWTNLQTELASVPGLVSRADRGCCELIVRMEVAMRTAAVVVREQGPTFTVLDAEGHLRGIRTRPETAFLLKAGALLKTLYSELGLSPSGRCRVALSPAAPSSNLDLFLHDLHEVRR